MQLDQFYSSAKGQAALAMVMRRLTSLWPLDSAHDAILGFGYAGPYLAPYMENAKKVILAMPGGQGASLTLSRRGNISCLTEEDSLPFLPASFDRVLIVHGLEESPVTAELLNEAWRVLTPEGRLVIIAPSRAGLWARSETTPFGSGRPFSRSQLKLALQQAQFQPQVWSGALYAPPASSFMRDKLVNGFERFGETVWPRFSGLILVEAVKRLYADMHGGRPQRVYAPRFVGTSPAKTSLLNKAYNKGR